MVVSFMQAIIISFFHIKGVLFCLFLTNQVRFDLHRDQYLINSVKFWKAISRNIADFFRKLILQLSCPNFFYDCPVPILILARNT